jgi:thiamine biosynthesis lipoprotein
VNAPGLVQITVGRPAMGTILEITLVAAGEAEARRVIERCFAETERLETILTTWREDGELARLNAKAGQGPQRASPELLWIVRDALRLSRETDDTFDVTVGPIVALWRAAERHNRLPSAAEIEEVRTHVGARVVHLDHERGRIALERGAAIDLGGFAKGWTLDRLGELLAREGIERGLLNFGGSSLLALGSPLDAPRWRVAVDAGPMLAFTDRSMSISSAFGQSFHVEGIELAHIVDPRSGLTVKWRQRAIVVAPDGATAEAWSKAFVVLPWETSARFAHSGELEVSVDNQGAAVSSSGFQRYVADEAAP